MIPDKKKPQKGKIISLSQKNQLPRLYPDRIAIALREGIRVIPIHNIMYLMAESNYTSVFLADNTCLLTSLTLKSYQNQLNPEVFLRIHQSYMIHKDAIQSFKIKENNLYLINGTRLPVAKSKKQNLMSYLKTLIIKK